MFELASERGLDAITVGDIAERAGVNRSSFYQHYADKDTLLADAIDALLEVAGADNPGILDFTAAPPAILTAYFRHIDQNASVYARVFGPHGSPVALTRLRDRIHSIVVGARARRRADSFDDLPPDVLAAGLSGAVLGVVGAWLALDPRPEAERAAQWMWDIVLGPRGSEGVGDASSSQI